MKATQLSTKLRLLKNLPEDTKLALSEASAKGDKELTSLSTSQLKEVFESLSQRSEVDPKIALFFSDAMRKQEAIDASKDKPSRGEFYLVDDPEIKTLENYILIKKLALHILGNTILPRTIKTYSDRINAMGEEKPLAYVIRKNLSKSSLASCRAAYIRKIMEDIVDLLSSAENTEDSLEKEKICQEAYEKTAEISFVWNKAMHGSQSYPKNTKTQKKKKNSKSTSLKNLDPNWRSTLISNTSNPTDQMLSAIIALVGCRPSEACGNVFVVRNQSRENCYEFYINGSKSSETTKGGQPLRKVSIDASYIPIAADAIKNSFKDLDYFLTPEIDPKNFGKRISRIAKKLGMHNVTLYSLRHQSTSDLKSLELDPDQISSVMGHASGKSKKAYGNRRNGKATSGGVIIEASVSRVVRNKKNHWLEKVIESKSSYQNPYSEYTI